MPHIFPKYCLIVTLVVLESYFCCLCYIPAFLIPKNRFCENRIENLFILLFDVLTRVIFFSFAYATTYQINFEHSRENDTIETFNNNSLFNLCHIS